MGSRLKTRSTPLERMRSLSSSRSPKVQRPIKKVTLGNKHLKSADLKKVMSDEGLDPPFYVTKTGILDEDILKNDVQNPDRLTISTTATSMQRSPNPKSICAIPNGSGSRSTSRKASVSDRNDRLKGRPPHHEGGPLQDASNQTKRCLPEFRSPERRQCPDRKICQPGYAYTEINPEPSVDAKELRVNLTFDIEEKKRVSFEKIQITGKQRPADRVVRRELFVAEENSTC